MHPSLTLRVLTLPALPAGAADDLVVTFLSGKGQIGLAIDGGLILLAPAAGRSFRSPHVHCEKRTSRSLAIYIGSVTSTFTASNSFTTHMTIDRGHPQGGVAVGVGLVLRRSGREKDLHALHMSSLSGMHQWSIAMGGSPFLSAPAASNASTISRCPSVAYVRAVPPIYTIQVGQLAPCSIVLAIFMSYNRLVLFFNPISTSPDSTFSLYARYHTSARVGSLQRCLFHHPGMKSSSLV